MTTAVPEPQRVDGMTRGLGWVVGGLLTLLMVGAALVGAAYALTPVALRHPVGTHYHLRLQLVVAGRPVSFADAKYQTPLNTDVCSAGLTKEPIHFHDGVDQFVHIHWQGMTGGLLLKNYGWNLVGGIPGVLGYRFDQLPKLLAIPIHGTVLPARPTGALYYIYTGDETGYQERSWPDFLHQDLDQFMSGRHVSRGWFDWLVPTASAHGDDAALSELNHVVGSAVIFVQHDRPSESQIKDRFAHLVPLPQSTCGG